MPSVYLKPATSGKTNFHNAQHGTTPEMKPHEPDFANLVNELMQLMMDEQLFTFVLGPEVESTNNLTKRLQRGRRSTKTAAGAHRRSVIVSVLESLRVTLKEFTLASALDEVPRWTAEGIGLFAKHWPALVGESLSMAPDIAARACCHQRRLEVMFRQTQ